MKAGYELSEPFFTKSVNCLEKHISHQIARNDVFSYVDFLKKIILSYPQKLYKEVFTLGYIMNLRKKIGTDPIIMVGACVLIFNERGELLMQHRIDNNCWGLAGGSMELGETLEEVAIREMFEETGLTPNNLTLFGIFSGEEFYYQYPHGDEVYNVSTAYICDDYVGELRFDPEEADNLQFFSLDALPEHISPPDKVVIRKYLAHITNE